MRKEPGPDAKITKVQLVAERKDKDTFIQSVSILAVSILAKNGKDLVIMTITYKRTS